MIFAKKNQPFILSKKDKQAQLSECSNIQIHFHSYLKSSLKMNYYSTMFVQATQQIQYNSTVFTYYLKHLELLFNKLFNICLINKQHLKIKKHVQSSTFRRRTFLNLKQQKKRNNFLLNFFKKSRQSFVIMFCTPLREMKLMVQLSLLEKL